jgi:hypothetical protein
MYAQSQAIVKPEKRTKIIIQRYTGAITTDGRYMMSKVPMVFG